MLKFTVIGVVFFLVASSSAQKPCCGPPQYMGGLGMTIGQVDPVHGPTSMSIYEYGAWNYSGSRFGLDVFIAYSNGTSVSFRLVQDYNQGFQWVILDAYKYCEKQPAPQIQPSVCVPDNATYLGGSYIGGMGGLLIDSWISTYQHPKDPVDGVSTIGVVDKTCYPASAQFQGNIYQGETPVPTMALGGWVNISVGIPEPAKWFTLPSYCNQEMNGISKSALPHGIPDLAPLYASINSKKNGAQ